MKKTKKTKIKTTPKPVVIGQSLCQVAGCHSNAITQNIHGMLLCWKHE